MTKEGTLKQVVNGGYCTGCGGCSFITQTPMEINDYGEYQPKLDLISKLSANVVDQAEFVCPSLNSKFNENRLAKEFLDEGKSSQFIGPYQSVYGGYVKEKEYRTNGTSGGFGTWIGAALYEEGLIDGVIHLKEVNREKIRDPFFKYGISKSLEEITKRSKTKYHVVEVSEVLNLVKNNPGRYLFIGLPCMVKTIRRIQLVDPIIKDSIKYTLALVCGHLKSINWTLSLVWGAGVTPENAKDILYRTKADDISARAYVFTAYSKDHKAVRKDSAEVVGGKFNQGALMLEACNFCDDVVGETSDITIGDAWLPRFEVDQQGTNLLIVRNKTIDKVLKKAAQADRLNLVDLEEKDAKDAQAGGFRQRREGLSYRLGKKDKKKLWRPVKRIVANSFLIPPLRKLIYNMRAQVTTKSRKLFSEALIKRDFSFYEKKMIVQLKMLRFLEVSSSASRIIRKKIVSIKHKNFK